MAEHGSAPLAQRLDIRRGAVPQPAVELSRFLELLAAKSRNGDESTVQFGQRGHVTPQLFKLADGEDVFLAFAPALFDVLQGDVGGHAGCHGPDCGRDLVRLSEVGLREAEDRQ